MSTHPELPAGVCTVCQTEPCACRQDMSGDAPLPRGRRRPRPQPWKRITGWCPVCWFRATATFHEAATTDGARQTFQLMHQAERPHCNAPLKIEMPKD